MLLLSRRIGEEILIADGTIKITVVGIKGTQVRLGIEAPKDVDVHREEVYERILQERGRLKEQEEVIK